MHPLRCAFDQCWPDCRLQTAERRLLDQHRIDDLPGSFAPQAFTAFVRHGHTAMLVEALRHNRDDVVSLARLLPALSRVYADPQRYAADVAAIARRLKKAGRATHAQAVLSRSLALPAARRELADMRARERDWAQVERLLLPLVEGVNPCVQSLERLAKIAEHVRHDPIAALGFARRMLAAQPGNARHVQRINRLTRVRSTANSRARRSGAGACKS